MRSHSYENVTATGSFSCKSNLCHMKGFAQKPILKQAQGNLDVAYFITYHIFKYIICYFSKHGLISIFIDMSNIISKHTLCCTILIVMKFFGFFQWWISCYSISILLCIKCNVTTIVELFEFRKESKISQYCILLPNY